MGWEIIFSFQLSSEIQIAKNFLDFWIGEGLGEHGVAQKCAEFPLPGKVLEVGVIDNDGSRDGFSGLWIDDWNEWGIGLRGDQLGEGHAFGLSQGIEGLQPRLRQGIFDGRFEPLAEAVGQGVRAVAGMIRVGTHLGDGAVVMEEGGTDQTEQGGGDKR